MEMTVVITGAGGGIGSCIARTFSADGHRVALFDVEENRIKALAEELGEGAVAAKVDITDVAAVEAALDLLGEAPRALINNAGIVAAGSFLDADQEQLRRLFDVNVIGTFTITQAVTRRMIAAGKGGAVVNLTSVHALASAASTGGYAASKAAVVAFTRQWALELGPHGIRVNAIAPGFIDAGMSTPGYANPEIRALRQAAVPLGRLGQDQDIADAAVFLASDRATFINGVHVPVDGGLMVALGGQKTSRG